MELGSIERLRFDSAALLRDPETQFVPNEEFGRTYGPKPGSFMEDESIRDGRCFESRWNESLRFNSVIFRRYKKPGGYMIPGETILSQKALGMNIDPHTSDFRVMHSGGGWYVGTVFVSCGQDSCKECSSWGHGGKTPEKGYELEPNSRETDYFKTKEDAEAALKQFKDTEGTDSEELPGHR